MGAGTGPATPGRVEPLPVRAEHALGCPRERDHRRYPRALDRLPPVRTERRQRRRQARRQHAAEPARHRRPRQRLVGHRVREPALAGAQRVTESTRVCPCSTNRPPPVSSPGPQASDLVRNEGWLNVGTDRVLRGSDPRRAADDRDETDPGASELLTTAGGGGANGSCYRLGQIERPGLADEPGLATAARRYPPGPSKPKRSEHHRLSGFSGTGAAGGSRDPRRSPANATTKTGVRVRFHSTRPATRPASRRPTPSWTQSTPTARTFRATGATGCAKGRRPRPQRLASLALPHRHRRAGRVGGLGGAVSTLRVGWPARSAR